LLSILSYTISGCGLIGKSQDSVKPSPVVVSEWPLDINEPAPFPGVLVTHDKYYYLMLCENYIIQNGIHP
jgi:hypothetical protein